MLGEQSAGYASDFPVTTILLDEAGPDTAVQARSAAAEAPATSASAGAVYKADIFFADIARDYFFQEDERPPADVDQQPDDAPDGLPPTGMARVTPLGSALLVSLILLTAAGAVFVVYRRR